MLSRNFILTCLLIVLLFVVHACTPSFWDEEKIEPTVEIEQAPDQDKPEPLPIQFVEAPKPKPKPKPKPAPKPKPKPKPKPGKVKKSAGGQGGGKASGSLNVVGRFDCSVEFYLDVMQSQGALLLLYEKNGPAYYEIHYDGGITPLNGLSGDYAPVARNLTLDHPRSGEFISRAEQRFGVGSYEVVLLIPAVVQDRFDALVSQVVPSSASASGTVTVRYQNSGGRLLIEFDQAVLNGEVVALNRRVAF